MNTQIDIIDSIENRSLGGCEHRKASFDEDCGRYGRKNTGHWMEEAQAQEEQR